MFLKKKLQVGSESPLNGHETTSHQSSTNTDDIYQLGVILLEVITGRQIYDQTEIHELKVEVLILDLKITRTSTNLFPYCIQTWQSPDFFCFFFF